MSTDEFLLVVFCLSDDERQALSPGRLRQRGPSPQLSDSEVITIQWVGEFLGLDRDKARFAPFRRSPRDACPALATLHRTTFVRQAAHLRAVKPRLAERLTCGAPWWLVDSRPVYACRFRRGGFNASRAPPASARTWSCGRPATACGGTCGPAGRESSRPCQGLRPMSPNSTWSCRWGPRGGVWVSATGTTGARTLRPKWTAAGITLLAPVKIASRDPDRDRTQALNRGRGRIETVQGQLTARRPVQRTWPRDLWHLCPHILRKVLCHTVAAFINVSRGRTPLRFDALRAV